MEKHDKEKSIKTNKDENWVDDLLVRQEHDLEVEEEILSSVPSRLKHKYFHEEDE